MSERGTVDFDLGGSVGIRLVHADAGDVRRVERQLGPLIAPLQRRPDITVRFVDRLEKRGQLVFVGIGDAGFDDDGFYVLRGKGKTEGRARIPFASIGGECEIVCERSLRGVPLLLAVVNLTALAKGILPLHASAFVHDGRGYLVTGWAKGGKSEVLLAFARRGAQYVGDEWVYIRPDRTMFGVPEPIRLWAWQLAQLRDFRERLPRGERLRLRTVDGAARLLDRMGRRTRRLGPVGSVARRLSAALAQQANTQIPPHRLFGSHAVVASAGLDQLVFTSSHEGAGVVVEPIAAAEVAARMVASNAYERAPLEAYYRQFRFAFPGLVNPLIEGARDLDAHLARKALAPVPAVWLRHPYPVRIDELFDQLAGGQVIGGPSEDKPRDASTAW